MPKVPGGSAQVLLQEALAALETCCTTLTRVDEAICDLTEASEAQHRRIQRHLSTIESVIPPMGTGAQPADDDNYTIDYDAIYQSEVELRQEVGYLQALHSKLDYLASLVRSGHDQLIGRDDDDMASVPWAAAVQAARIEAHEEERMRLAREVHDGPAQVLANAMIGLEYCQIVATRAPSELDAELKRLRDMMREGLVDVRRFMFDLRPTTLATLGLNATLSRYVEDFQRAAGLAVDLKLPAEELNFDDRAQIAIFRIVQEALQNIQKHARATHVQVELASTADGAMRLVISDDGLGFEPQTVQPTTGSGAGLLGMRERAVVLGANLTVTSAPGRGTVITLQLPSAWGRAAGAEHGQPGPAEGSASTDPGGHAGPPAEEDGTTQ